eukprot:10986891-Lingulodinium_polyedra.AAC.1
MKCHVDDNLLEARAGPPEGSEPARRLAGASEVGRGGSAPAPAPGTAGYMGADGDCGISEFNLALD